MLPVVRYWGTGSFIFSIGEQVRTLNLRILVRLFCFITKSRSARFGSGIALMSRWCVDLRILQAASSF